MASSENTDEIGSCSAESSIVWDRNDLKAYGIIVITLPSHQFFPHETNAPLTGLDPMILSTSHDVDAKLPNVPRETYLFSVHLNMAIRYDDKLEFDNFTLLLILRVGVWLCGGMEEPEYRKVALQHLFAFKAVAESRWKKILV